MIGGVAMQDVSRSRRMELTDLMIMVAAVGIAMAFVRYELFNARGVIPTYGKNGLYFEKEYASLDRHELATVVSLVLTVLGPALLVAALRRNTAGIRVLVRRPGIVACGVATVAAFGILGRAVLQAALNGWP